MNLKFNIEISTTYEKPTQKIRVLSENWMSNNMYCPICGNTRLIHLKNNSPVADFQCENCGGIFELKSHHGNVGKKIVDGAYSTMIQRITSNKNPDLFILQYSDQYEVTNLHLIPRFFFVPEIIEKRSPLSPNAKRSGWVGCNILYQNIPLQGRISIIYNGIPRKPSDVLTIYKQLSQLQTNSLDARGWLLDILNCVNNIETDIFTLSDMYKYHDFLQTKYKNNNNINAKIRQQLQILRDKGFITFLGNGYYQKIK